MTARSANSHSTPLSPPSTAGMDLVQQLLLLRQRQPPPQVQRHTNPLALLRQASVQRRGEEGEAVREPRPSTAGAVTAGDPGGGAADAGVLSAEALLAAMAAGRRQPGAGRAQQRGAEEILLLGGGGGGMGGAAGPAAAPGFASTFTNPLALEAAEELAQAATPPPPPTQQQQPLLQQPAADAEQPAWVDVPAPPASARASTGRPQQQQQVPAARRPQSPLGLARYSAPPAAAVAAAAGAAGAPAGAAGAAAEGDTLDAFGAGAGSTGASGAAHRRQQSQPAQPRPAGPLHTAMPWDALSRFEGQVEAAAEVEAAARQTAGARGTAGAHQQTTRPAVLERPSPARLALALGEEGASAVSLSHQPGAGSPSSAPSGCDAEDDAAAAARLMPPAQVAARPGGGGSSAISTLLGVLHERGYERGRARDQGLAGTAVPPRQWRQAGGRSPSTSPARR